MKASFNTNYATGTAAPVHRAPAAREDYLVFSLDNREYGVILETVQELCNYDAVKPLSNAPAIIAGVVSLPGGPVQVVNLHRVLSPDVPDNDRLSDVIILRCGDRVSGIAVDSVIDVISLLPGQVGPVSSEDSVSLAVVGKRSIVLLDAQKLMTGPSREPVQRLAA